MEAYRGRRTADTKVCALLVFVLSITVTGCDVFNVRGKDPAAARSLGLLADLPYGLGNSVLLTDGDEDFDSGLPLE